MDSVAALGSTVEDVLRHVPVFVGEELAVQHPRDALKLDTFRRVVGVGFGVEDDS